ncbi:MAG: ABC transporter permease [Hahellaceae bacterium]|nr:ABC transporter permease [Hahellaceae bacterium]MCP5170575.1 ABC transporter permease [Hahellaceae bacterium]
MNLLDRLEFCQQAITRHRFRSAMLMLSVVIGICAVIILTSLGEGARQYVLDEFRQLGSNVLIVLPGRKETSGGLPSFHGESARDLTLADAEALERLSGVIKTAPLIAGLTEWSFESRHRESFTIGTSQVFFRIRQLNVQRGIPLPSIEVGEAQAVCVLGSKLKQELFGAQPALGEWVRAAGTRYRVIGILEDKGQAMGMDMSDAVLIPVASSQKLFNQEGLFRVFVEARPGSDIEDLKRRIEHLMRDRHQGDLDVTVITQDSIMGAFNKIFDILTYALMAIASISLLVSGILIMNVTLISISQRTEEIGLLKALGASRREIRLIFVTEALLITLVAALVGLVMAYVLLAAGRYQWPQIPFQAPLWAVWSALAVAVVSATLFSWLPASKASRLDPVSALTQTQARK